MRPSFFGRQGLRGHAGLPVERGRRTTGARNPRSASANAVCAGRHAVRQASTVDPAPQSRLAGRLLQQELGILHSGRVGDYVMWIMVGPALFTVAFART